MTGRPYAFFLRRDRSHGHRDRAPAWRVAVRLPASFSPQYVDVTHDASREDAMAVMQALQEEAVKLLLETRQLGIR